MEHFEQEIRVLYEGKIAFKSMDNYDDGDVYLETLKYSATRSFDYKKNNIVRNINEFIQRIENFNEITLIIGSNGVGKSYLLENIKKYYEANGLYVNFIKFKEFTSAKKIIEQCSADSDYLILDGLDEINENIQNSILEFVFSIRNKKVIVSSRKDFAQKVGLINIEYNIYEIEQLRDYEVDKILTKKKIDIYSYKRLYNILKIPRFLISFLEVKDYVTEDINKYDLLEMIINKHFNKLKERTKIKIEVNIHKKILQALALIMMMTGKINLTMEEFTNFMSNIKHLDIKSYILNKDIIDTFLNNQVLLNNGNIISFENKEVMEFLAAREIYENNFSNKELFDIVSIANTGEIDSFWFNTLSYLICKSKVYYDLILNYTFKKLSFQDNLLDFLLSIDYNQDTDAMAAKNIKDFILQYTKLYQYMSLHSYDSDGILNILKINPNECLKQLTDILISLNMESELSKFNIIYINNILSCINILFENFKYNKSEVKTLKKYFFENKKYYIQSREFRVRYMHICLLIFDSGEVDKIIDNSNIDKRLLSIILYNDKHFNNLKNLDKYINNYILNYNRKFDDNFILGDSRVIEFINDNYDLQRMKNFLNGIKNENNIASFIRFSNIEEFKKLRQKFMKKSIALILYNNIMKYLLTDLKNEDKNLKREFIFFNKKDYGMKIILEPCIKFNYISIDYLNDTSNQDYITKYVKELILIEFLKKEKDIKALYEKLENKEKIFYLWKYKLDKSIKEKLESQIKVLFKEDYLDYKKELIKYESKDFIQTKQILNVLNETDNIYYKIDQLIDLLKDEKKIKLVFDNKIFKNILNKISKEISDYVKNIDSNKIILSDLNNNLSQINFDIHYYSDAIYILSKMNYDINMYSNTNILFLYDIDGINPIYTDNDYDILLGYLKNKDAKEYVKSYLYYIIRKLKNYNSNEVFDIILSWFDYIEFDEYQVNIILGFIETNINLLDDNKLKKLYKFRKYKLCQDILIELGYEDEINNRIDYIKNNLIFAGDLIAIEKNGNFEYSSGNYITPLSKIGLKNKKYIYDILSFMFSKYNEGDYYYFSKYILDMVIKYINYNKLNVDDLIEYIVSSEKNNNNRYLYNICKNINSLRKKGYRSVIEAVNQYNNTITNQYIKIYSYDDLYNEVKDILNNRVFDDIKRMRFLEIFRDKNTKKINPLLEETYQFLIGYELNRILTLEGYSTKTIYESTAYDKKRNDIQLITEGFIQDIVIETKLSNNSDISNEENIKNYINTKLENYRREFNVPKILFVIINQKLLYETCKKKIDLINENSNGVVDTILIDLKEEFK